MLQKNETPGLAGPGATRTKLDDALFLAERNYHIFPCEKNGKKALIKGFPERATRDPEQIRRWWQNDPDRNIAISTSAYGDNEALIVIDIDDKDGKQGSQTLRGLELLDYEFPPTVWQATPSGGRHLIYRAARAMRQGVNILGDGLDIRSRGGYIVAHGSEIDGRGYKLHYPQGPDGKIIRDPAPAPQWLIDRLGVARERDPLASSPIEGIDPERARARAVEYLKSAPPSIEGNGGDLNAVRVAMVCRDFGLTEAETLDTMLGFWNGDCEPPWDPEELETKVRNAFRYAKDRQGAAAPEAVFTAVETAAGERDGDGGGNGGGMAQSAPAGLPAPLTLAFDGDAEIRPAPMLVTGVLPFVGVGFLGGQSGGGKTFLSVDLGVRVACGAPFFGRKVKERCGVLLVAAEGGGTIAARVHAARRTIAPEAGRLPIVMATSCPDLRARGGWEWLSEIVKRADAWTRDQFGVRLGLIVIDTLGAALGMEDENSNAEANGVMRDLRLVSEKMGAMVLAVHHYGKTAESGLRGASAWRGGADVILSITADRNETTGAVSNRRLSLAKSRDGVEGPISAFELAEFRLGVDEDLQSITTCTVRPLDAPAASPGARLKPAERSYRAAMAVLADKAQSIRLDDGREIAALDRETIRQEFNSGWSADGDGSKVADARRKAFKRGEDGLLRAGLVLRREIDGRMMVWAA